MSRCFPFPPPGYERKHKLEDLDLVKQADHKEKKHKKDKERRKNKEKKEKDGSDDKHRDKKDRKGKHKDKKEKHKDKKDKDGRGKDKEKSSISEESAVASKLEEESRKSINPRVASNDGGNTVDEKKNSTDFQDRHRSKGFQNSLHSLDAGESKFVLELDRRTRDNETSRGSQLPLGVAGVEQRGQGAAARDKIHSSSLSATEKEYGKDKCVGSNKLDGKGLKNEVGGNGILQNLTTVGKSKAEGIPRRVEEHKDRREGKEKYNEIGNDKREEKHKDENKKIHGMEKGKEKKECSIVNIKNKKNDQENSKDKKNHITVVSGSSADLLNDSKNSTLNDGNIKKRKDVIANGFLMESESRPVKAQRPGPLQSPMENGRKLVPYRDPAPSLPISNKDDVVSNCVRLDKNESLINGVIDIKKPSPSKPNPSGFVVSDQRNEASKPSTSNSGYSNKIKFVPKIEDLIAEASRRSPHPDSKYLSELLSVPTSVECGGNDDQEWLFSKKGPSQKLNSKSVTVEGKHRVWSEAMHIDSADVCALPYVIPY